MFIPLHIYSGYTFLKSSLKINDIVEYALTNNLTHIGLSDKHIMYGFAKFSSLCKKNNITPILGIDINIEGNVFTFFVKNEVGYKNLIKLSSVVSIRDNKILSFEDLKDKSEGLISIMHTKNNNIFEEGKMEEKILNDKFLKIKENLSSSFYIGLEIYSDEEIRLGEYIRQYALRNDLKILAFPHIRYLKKEDAKTFKILEAIENDEHLEFSDLDDIKDSYFYFKDELEIKKYYTFEEIETTFEITKEIDFELNKKRGELLHFSDEKKNSEDILKDKILEGLKFRNIDLNSQKEYKDRLNYEFLTIKNMGYANYFLIVQDYVNYAKTHNILVGPGRGSAAGSLISYILNITDVDPLKYNLLFERFLNPYRKSMPDIDIDFEDTKREDVISYIKSKYGIKRCARIITFQTILAKQALRDVGRVFSISPQVINRLSKLIPTNFKINGRVDYSLDDIYNSLNEFKKEIDEDYELKILFKYAKAIEGLPRQKGMHAAGILLNNTPLIETLPVTFENNELITQFEKDYLEEQGFLKMDLLGLTNLSTISRTLKSINENLNIKLKFENIPINDPSIFPLINSYKVMGLFQLDTSAALHAIKQIKPTSFNEIVALISLDRPGPQEYIPTYINNKIHSRNLTFIDESLKDTYGVIVYQEQIMQICRNYAGFNLANADLFRRAITKKNKDDMLLMKDKFINGALKKGHKVKEINKVYEDILKFASYGFNKSHAVSYAMISSKMAYLKAHYGAHFYSAILENQYLNNSSKFLSLVSEINSNNIKILNPDINLSTLEFKVYEDKLLMPLVGINNLARKVGENIFNERIRNGKFLTYEDFLIRMYATNDKITVNQLEKLIDAGAFDNLISNREALKESAANAISYASNCVYNENRLFNNFGLDLIIPNVKEDKIKRLKNEIEALGVMVSDSLLNYVNISKDEIITPINSLVINKISKIILLITNIKEITIKKGKNKGNVMAFVDGFDSSSSIEITLFASTYLKYKHLIKENSILKVIGKKEHFNDKISFIVNEIIEVI